MGITVELTEREFFLIRMSLADTKRDFESYSGKETHDEDAMFDNQVILEIAELQQKFPDPDDDEYYLEGE